MDGADVEYVSACLDSVRGAATEEEARRSTQAWQAWGRQQRCDSDSSVSESDTSTRAQPLPIDGGKKLRIPPTAAAAIMAALAALAGATWQHRCSRTALHCSNET